MSWLTDARRERRIISPEEGPPPNLCFHCQVPVKWQPEDTRASNEGSFVDEEGNFTCPNGFLHQG